MSRPTVRVVGLGPGDQNLITQRSMSLIVESPVVRLRTRVHPAAAGLIDVLSYDQWYEEAVSFDELYVRIAEDLCRLAASSTNREVVYVVPGSPVVAERTVELLRARDDVFVVCEPAVSVIDVACAALGVDPVARGLRILDALDSAEHFSGPGPLLVLQTYSPEVLSVVAGRLHPEALVTVLFHLGLSDQRLEQLRARELASFRDADHLTSIWIDGIRGAGEAMEDLVRFARRLRAECPWDQEQTHASLTRHLLEESYEALDALEALVSAQDAGTLDDQLVDHVEEELGDLLFQVVFHAELADEEELFNLATIADAVRDKLTCRHPHVFGDVHVNDSSDVAARWEKLKASEKGRSSVTEGIATQLPALSLYAKLLAKSELVGRVSRGPEQTHEAALGALEELHRVSSNAKDSSSEDVSPAWSQVLIALLEEARFVGVDLEGVLRASALRLLDEIRTLEESGER
ncbi:MAG TPA: MazG nucleotide pyrophosphohydrolase domain-containing protein [Acidimicrobiales bacterium]